MPQSGWVSALRLPGLHSGAHEPQILSPRTTATEARLQRPKPNTAKKQKDRNCFKKIKRMYIFVKKNLQREVGALFLKTML